MKLKIYLIILSVLFQYSVIFGSDNVPRQKTKINLDWKFKTGDYPEAVKPEFSDKDWRKIQLPHDWSIEGKFETKNPTGSMGAFLPSGIAWYRKIIDIKPIQEKRVIIEFEGVYMNSDVYLNGHHLVHQAYGYTSFYYDLTPFLNPEGNNILAVRVDNSCLPQDRWYSGAGIYRNVWLHTVSGVCVDIHGTYITTPFVHANASSVNVKTFITNKLSVGKNVLLKTEIVDKDNQVVASALSKAFIASDSSQYIYQEVVINRPHLWDTEDPYLYTAKSSIVDDGKIVDLYKSSFGIRIAEFNSEQGFVLNGKKTILKGVCIHQHAAGLGTALHEKTIERHLVAFKQMGCNAIRLSHYPHAPFLYDLADRMGFLLIGEAFDNWKGYKSDYGNKYLSFNDTWKKDLKKFIDLHRNHPSIVIWSVGNEVQVNVKDYDECMRIVKELTDFVHHYESSRPVTSAIAPGSRKVRNLNPDPMTFVGDVAGFNYQVQLYENDRKSHPDLIIIGTETKPYYERNFLKKSGDELVFEGAEESVNSYFYMTPIIAGQFIWSGIDYLGESAGWPLKGWPNGLIDLCGNRKPFSYFTESLYSENPMVHIAIRDKNDSIVGFKSWSWPAVTSHWNWKENDTLEVYTYTNTDSVELFVNEKSMGVAKLADFPDRVIKWKVPYHAGIIRAIGMKEGKQILNKLETSGKPSDIALIPVDSSLLANREDIVYVEVSITDKNGLTVPDSNHLINFKISDNANIIGVGNGNLFSGESFKSNSISAYKGKCIVIIQSASTKAGEVILEATSKGLEKSIVKLEMNNAL